MNLEFDPKPPGDFFTGPLTCGSCHTVEPNNNKLHHDASMTLLFENMPNGDELFRTWGAEHNMPGTPLPGAIWLLAAPLLWATYKASRR